MSHFDPDTALEYVVDTLDRRQPSWMVSQLIGNLGARASEAVPAAVAALSNHDLPIRMWATRIIGRIGKPAVDAVPALQEALRDRDWGFAKTQKRRYVESLECKKSERAVRPPKRRRAARLTLPSPSTPTLASRSPSE